MNTEKSGLYEGKGEVSPEDILEMHCPDLKHRQPLFYNGALAALKEYASRAIIDFCNKIQDQPPSLPQDQKGWPEEEAKAFALQFWWWVEKNNFRILTRNQFVTHGDINTFDKVWQIHELMEEYLRTQLPSGNGGDKEEVKEGNGWVKVSVDNELLFIKNSSRGTVYFVIDPKPEHACKCRIGNTPGDYDSIDTENGATFEQVMDAFNNEPEKG